MLRSPLTSNGRKVAQSLTLLIGLFVVAFSLQATQASAASTKRIELGAKNVNSLKPNCGKDFSRDCVVEGKVTAFQALSAVSPGRNFVVPFPGKLVSWSISLAQPTRAEVDNNPAQLPTFNLIFGSPSQARISVLSPVNPNKKGAPKYRLARQSPLEILNPYFGSRVQFALTKPLNVYKNNVIALTIPTWAPALWAPKACNLTSVDYLDPEACLKASKDYTWRGSRVPRGTDKCTLKRTDAGEPNEQLSKTRPQMGINSTRPYGCYYGANVLLYSATIVGR